MDITTLARLHATLDFVVDAEQMLRELHETEPHSSPTVTRVSQLLGEARDLLRGMLGRRILESPERR